MNSKTATFTCRRAHLRPLSSRLPNPLIRLHASRTYASRSATQDPNKPIILEQPDKFRPPSHPQRIRRRQRKLYYGRDLTEEDKAELNSKQYPYMFPPKESLTHWILTTRWLHVSFALAVLGSLAIYVNYNDLKKRNAPRWPDLLPTPSLAFRNPPLFLKQYAAIWKLNKDADDVYYRDKMSKEEGDYRKAKLYRKAHGLPETSGLAARWGLGTVDVEEDEKLRKLQEEERLRALATEKDKEGNVVKRKMKLFGIWEV